MAIVKCPACASRNLIHVESWGGDLRYCVACGAEFYVDEDHWQVPPPPLWSTYPYDPEPQT